MTYPAAAWERAMTVQEVILKALSGELHWFRAAEILGWSPRTLRRWRERYETHGHSGLIDRRLLRPSKRRVPPLQVERVLRLYREHYAGFNVRHFHQIARREHGVTVSYSFVKHTLQAAGLVKKYRPRGRHRQRRDPRACFGEMLHLDGSVHAWFTGEDVRPCLIAVSDDATKRVLHAALYPRESTWAVMTSLGAVLRAEGLPMALYTDRAHWAFHTPKANGPVDKARLTQVGRALAQWGSSTSLRIHRRRVGGVSGSIARSRIVSSTSSASRGSRPSRRPTTTSPANSCPSTTPRLRAPRAIRRVRSCRSAPPISTTFCVMRSRVSSPATTP